MFTPAFYQATYRKGVEIPASARLGVPTMSISR